MLKKGVTLRGLEVFHALAATGSVAAAADTTGLSQPAVSQQLRNLVRNAQKEMNQEPPKPGSSYKKLFQLVREACR